jgi:hypothetical protein
MWDKKDPRARESTVSAKSSAQGVKSAVSGKKHADQIAPQARTGPNLKEGTYSDGHPLDQVEYLECKLILKPDRFTAAKTFLEYGALALQRRPTFRLSV